MAETPSPALKISFDLDGCFWEKPEFYALMGTLLNVVGNQSVGILTGRPTVDRDTDLKKIWELGFRPKFYYSRDVIDNEAEPSAKWKAEMIKKLKLDVVFDDDAHHIAEYLGDDVKRVLLIKPRASFMPEKF